MRQSNKGMPAATFARVILITAICTVGLARRSEANAAFYSDCWMSSDYDAYNGWEPIYGMGVVEANYGEYYDVSTESYLYGPNDEWEGCFDEDEYYAEADTTLNDASDDGSEMDYEVDSDHSADGDGGPVDLGWSDHETGVGSYTSHYIYASQLGPNRWGYSLNPDSQNSQCSHLGYTWDYYEPIVGLSDTGWYAIFGSAGGCVGHCVAGQSGSATGPYGSPVNSIPAC